MRAIDTNVLVRVVTRDDENQWRAADECIADGAWVSQIVLAETVWVLVALYGLPRPALAGVLEKLLRHVSIIVENPEIVEAALAQFKQSKTISFADCLILESARRAGRLPLATFDRNLAKLAGVERIGAKAG